MKLRWYWFLFDGLPVTFHLARDYDVRWTHIRGIGIGHWFFGAVRSEDVEKKS